MSGPCACGRPVAFVVLASGHTVEACACGSRRSLRGRTLDDIDREDAAYRASIGQPARYATRPCAADGCDGFASGRGQSLCPSHVYERRKILNREYSREYMRQKHGHKPRRPRAA